jgi:uncharacterized protein YyaL (SSP411 family)
MMMQGLPRLATTESTGMPVISAVLNWRGWSDGLAEARSRQLPMLVVAEPGWTNGAQRLAAQIAGDERLKDALSTLVVPVLVDPTEDLAPLDRWRLFSLAQTGSIGPPLILLASDEGLPLLTYPSMVVEGDKERPSLAAVIQATSDAWDNDAEMVRAECRTLADALAAATEGDVAGARWDRLAEMADTRHGGLETLPRQPQPTLLRFLMDDSEAMAEGQAARAWVETTLAGMARGGVRDQLDRGFFRAARDDRWVTPHFEKVIPLNAQLAAAYAQAATVFARKDFRALAIELVTFCQIALKEEVDRIASESQYYTWTAGEVRDTVPAASLQVICLHYGIVPGSRRYALHQAISEPGIERFGTQPLEELLTRLHQGKATMAAARRSRPCPQPKAVSSLAWRAETIRGLYDASRWDVAVDRALLDRSLDALTSAPGENGYARADGTATLADQAALLAALIAAGDDEQWRARAGALARLITERYVRDGVPYVAAGVSDAPDASYDVVDAEVPASLGTLVTGLRTVAQWDGFDDLATVADAVAAFTSGMVDIAGPWAASSW